MRARVWLGGAALLLVSSLPASAQQRDWSAWQGCWQGIGLDVPVGEMVCVLPGADAASARIATVRGGEILSEVVVRADDVARPVEEGGCKGTQRTSFSADGRRIYTRSEMDCGTGTLRRATSGAFAMVSDVEWVDVQALTVAGEHSTRTARFRVVPSTRVDAAILALLPTEQRLAQETARVHASAPLTTDAIIEASRIVAPPVVESILAARQHGFDLKVATLKHLKNGGVPATTIDVMVALSYPEHFAVAEQSASEQYSSPSSAYRGSDCSYDPFMGRRSYDPDCDSSRYGRYGYGYDRFGYSPYGNNYYNNGYSYYGRDPIVVVINPTEADGGGSVVKGQGYTRGTSSPSRPASTPTSTSTAGKSSAGSTTGSSSGTSTGSSTSSGSTTTRTAKPRGGG